MYVPGAKRYVHKKDKKIDMAHILSFDDARKVAVAGLYGPAICGEGPCIGRPTVVLIVGGCEMRCAWCDSLYAVLPDYGAYWKRMSCAEIFTRIEELSPAPILVTITGGNPALSNLEHLIESGHDAQYTFALHTQGSIARPWFTFLDHLVLSPPPPSSTMPTNWDTLDRCCEIAAKDGHCDVTFKVTIFTDRDYDYAHKVAERYPFHKLYLQVGTPREVEEDLTLILETLDRTIRLASKVTAEQWNDVVVLPQLQVLLGEKMGNS